MSKDKIQQCTVHFQMDGKSYGIVMPAESWEDAERRLAAIRLTGRVEGFPCYTVKMPGPLAYLALPFMPLAMWFLNTFFRGKPRP